jgi:hypothetical protein
MTRAHSLTAGLIVLVLGLFFLPAQAGAQDEGSGRLLEVASSVLPRDSEVVDMVALGDGRVVLASTSGIYVADVWESELDFIGAFDQLNIVGMSPEPGSRGSLTLVDARTRRILRVDSRGRIRSWKRLHLEGRITGAVRSPCGWWLLEASSGIGTESLIRVDEKGAGVDTVRLKGGAHAASMVDSTVLVGQRIKPFRLVRVGCPRPGEENPVVQAHGVPARERFPGGAWRALRPFGVGNQVYRTIADLAGDRRWIIVYDTRGEIVLERRIEAPIGLVGELCGGVVGFRRITDPEVVIYEFEGGAGISCAAHR